MRGISWIRQTHTGSSKDGNKSWRPATTTEGVLDFEYRTDGFFTVGYNGARRYRQATLAPEEMASDRWLEILKSRLGLS